MIAYLLCDGRGLVAGIQDDVFYLVALIQYFIGIKEGYGIMDIARNAFEAEYEAVDIAEGLMGIGEAFFMFPLVIVSRIRVGD